MLVPSSNSNKNALREEYSSSPSFDLGHTHVVLDPHGVLRTTVLKEGQYELNDVMELLEALAEFTNNTPYPSLVRSHNNSKFITPTAEARSYMANVNRPYRASASAYLINSLPQRIVGNFYLSFNTPTTPTKLFQKEENALLWLKNYKS